MNRLTLLGSGGGAAGAGGGAWAPSDLGSALRAWYKFDALTGSNGDPQGSIPDSSGNGFTLTQSGTTRATLAAADLNSKNTLRFTGANTQRYPLSVTILNGGSAGSFYLVQKTVAAGTQNGSPEWGTGGATYSPYSDGNIYDDFGATVRKTVGTPTGGAMTRYLIISAYSAANDWACFVDGGTGGSSGGTTALFSTATNTVAWAGTGVALGANSGLTAFDGWYAEVFYTNAKQSTTDRQKAEGYLAHKWFGAGASNNLAAAHPYKTTPP